MALRLRRVGVRVPWWLRCRTSAARAATLVLSHGCPVASARVATRDVTPSSIVATPSTFAGEEQAVGVSRRSGAIWLCRACPTMASTCPRLCGTRAGEVSMRLMRRRRAPELVVALEDEELASSSDDRDVRSPTRPSGDSGEPRARAGNLDERPRLQGRLVVTCRCAGSPLRPGALEGAEGRRGAPKIGARRLRPICVMKRSWIASTVQVRLLACPRSSLHARRTEEDSGLEVGVQVDGGASRRGSRC